eukprot:6536384-Lingulodinium_polyedra.AAC.1
MQGAARGVVSTLGRWRRLLPGAGEGAGSGTRPEMQSGKGLCLCQVLLRAPAHLQGVLTCRCCSRTRRPACTSEVCPARERRSAVPRI